MEAIARSVLVTVRYNLLEMILAPHALVMRRGELFLRALNLSKNWRTPEDMRLGTFKLDGLTEVSVLEDAFDPLPICTTSSVDENEKLLLSVA